jgi:hypothetical protein
MTKKLALNRETIKRLSRAIPLRMSPSEDSCLPKVACPARPDTIVDATCDSCATCDQNTCDCYTEDCGTNTGWLDCE